MTYKLFLDDVRDPSWRNNGNPDDWIVCRSVDEAIRVFEDMGWPAMISFDHDLGNQVPTGMDFARWLVNHDLDTQSMPQNFVYTVHSQNPVGTANIRGLLENYLDSKKG